MKTWRMKKIRSATRGNAKMSNNEQVLAEITSFLQAVDSYPDRFAQDPQITFEQHLCSLIPSDQAESARRG